jgi:hypothetical protein
VKKDSVSPGHVTGHSTGGKVVTVAERVREKVERVARWEKENPGLSWHSPEYPEKEPSIHYPSQLLDSKAYRSLGRCSLLVYYDFLRKRRMKSIKRNGKDVWIIENNGEIIYPYSEAEEMGFSKQQFRNAIDELQARGLIDIKHLGKGGRKPAEGTGDVSKYWIDDRWKDYGTDDFRPPRNPRRKETKKGRGWGMINEDPELKKAITEKRNRTIRNRKRNRAKKTDPKCEKT